MVQQQLEDKTFLNEFITNKGNEATDKAHAIVKEF